MRQGVGQRIGHGLVVPNGHEPAELPVIQNLAGTAGAVRRDDAAAAGQRLRSDVAEPLPAGADGEDGGPRYPGVGVGVVARKRSAVREPHLRDPAFQQGAFLALSEDDEPDLRPPPGKAGKGPQERREVLLVPEASGTEDYGRLSGLKPWMWRGRLRRGTNLCEKLRCDDGVVDDVDFFGREEAQGPHLVRYAAGDADAGGGAGRQQVVAQGAEARLEGAALHREHAALGQDDLEGASQDDLRQQGAHGGVDGEQEAEPAAPNLTQEAQEGPVEVNDPNLRDEAREHGSARVQEQHGDGEPAARQGVRQPQGRPFRPSRSRVAQQERNGRQPGVHA